MLRPEPTGLLRLTSFNARAHRDLAQAITQLEESGVQSLVLDLRWVGILCGAQSLVLDSRWMEVVCGAQILVLDARWVGFTYNGAKSLILDQGELGL